MLRPLTTARREDPNMGSEEKPRYLFGGGGMPDMEGAAKSLGQELK